MVRKKIIYFYIVSEEHESRDIVDKIDIAFIGPAEIGLIKLKEYAYEKLKNIGDALGIKCRVCEHLTKSHIQIVRGEYKCNECHENNNICKLNDRELENFLTTIKKLALDFFGNK